MSQLLHVSANFPPASPPQYLSLSSVSHNGSDDPDVNAIEITANITILAAAIVADYTTV